MPPNVKPKGPSLSAGTDTGRNLAYCRAHDRQALLRGTELLTRSNSRLDQGQKVWQPMQWRSAAALLSAPGLRRRCIRRRRSAPRFWSRCTVSASSWAMPGKAQPLDGSARAQRLRCARRAACPERCVVLVPACSEVVQESKVDLHASDKKLRCAKCGEGHWLRRGLTSLRGRRRQVHLDTVHDSVRTVLDPLGAH